MTHIKSVRYFAFAKHASDIINTAIRDRERTGIDENSTHSTHLSKVLPVAEVESILQSEELRATESWSEAFEDLQESEEADLSFGDFPSLDSLLNRASDRRDAMAQVVALNESFRGFVLTLALWVDNRDLFEVIASQAAENSGRTDAALEQIEDFIHREIDEIMYEDLRDAAALIFGLSEQ